MPGTPTPRPPCFPLYSQTRYRGDYAYRVDTTCRCGRTHVVHLYTADNPGMPSDRADYALA